MGNAVTLSDLPLELRAQYSANSAPMTAFRAQLEKDHGLAPGALGTAKLDVQPGTDLTGMYQAIAADMGKEAQAKRAKLEAQQAADAKLYNPTTGDYEIHGLKIPAWAGNALAGAGKSVADTGRGLAQLFGADNQAAIDEAAHLDEPLMRTGAGLTGYLGGTLGTMAIPGSAVTKALPITTTGVKGVPAAAIVGAGLGATQPVETGASRTGQAILGAVAGGAGQAVGAGLSAAARPAAQAADAVTQAAVRRASALGIPLTAAQISDNPALKGVTDLLATLPLSGADKASGAQQKAFNRALAASVGADTDEPLLAVRAGRKNLSDAYDAVKSRNALQLEPWHVDALTDEINNYAANGLSTTKPTTVKNLKSLRDQIVTQADEEGKLTGEQYKTMRSRIGEYEQRQNAAGGDPDYQKALGSFKATLDQAFKSGLSPEDAALLAQTDRQWANLKTLEKIAPVTPGGDFDFNALARQVTSKQVGNTAQRNAFLYSQGDQTLPDLARIGQMLGRTNPTANPGLVDLAKRAGRGAVRLGAAPTVGLGYYSLQNHDDPSAAALRAAMLTGLTVGGGRALSAGLRSRAFAEGMPRLGALGQAAQAYPQAGVGALNTALRGLGDGSEGQ